MLFCGIGESVKKRNIIKLIFIFALSATMLLSFASCDYIEKIPVVGDFLSNLIPCEHEEVIDAAKAPTCTASGLTEGKHCALCNDVLLAQNAVPSLGHTEVKDEAKSPSCTETGLSEGKHCTVCGEVTVPQRKLSLAAHDYNYSVTLAPTAETEGEAEVICEDCDFIKYAELPVLSEWTFLMNVEATCLVNGGEYYTYDALIENEGSEEVSTYCVITLKVDLGIGAHVNSNPSAFISWSDDDYTYRAFYCSECSRLVVEERVPIIKDCKHEFTYTVIFTPTEALSGAADIACSLCDFSKEIELPALSEWMLDTYISPTCIAYGYKIYTYNTLVEDKEGESDDAYCIIEMKIDIGYGDHINADPPINLTWEFDGYIYEAYFCAECQEIIVVGKTLKSNE